MSENSNLTATAQFTEQNQARLCSLNGFAATIKYPHGVLAKRQGNIFHCEQTLS